MSTIKWQSWCRLCARIDGGNELKLEIIKTVSDILQKYFHIVISKSDDCLSVVCQECLELVLNVGKFGVRCVEVNKMFLELTKGCFSDDILESVRETYGLSGSYEYINCEAKAEPLPEPEFVEPDLNDTVSLLDEHGNDDDEDYTPQCKKIRTNPEGSCQMKTRGNSKSTEINTTKSTNNNWKNSIESKPKSSRRKPIKGTDVWCHLCDTTFNLPRRYMDHMRNKHSPNILPFACDKCPKFFVSEKKMLQHATCHRPVEQKKIHPCPECDKTFSSAANVQLHIRYAHIGDRPFVCEECGKSCATKGALKEHQFSHTDLRPIKCKDCSKTFKDITGLKKHSEQHNSDTFECLQCGKRMNTRPALKTHMIVHTDEKRYKCKYCGNAFKRYTQFKDHLNTHTGHRPFSCIFCNVSYADRSNLRAHKKKCHPVELKAANEVKT